MLLSLEIGVSWAGTPSKKRANKKTNFIKKVDVASHKMNINQSEWNYIRKE